MASRFRQEMPPSGGYGPVDWAKKIPKRMSGYSVFGGFFAVTGVGWVFYVLERARKKKLELEMRDSRIALEPFMYAEQQRMFLRQLRANREEENEVMKDVPGWEVGKWEGQPVYYNLAKRFPQVHPEEYYAHNRYYDMYDRLFERRKH